MAQLAQLRAIYNISIILINIFHPPLPSICVYWAVTLKGSSMYFVFCRAFVKTVSRSRQHLVCQRNGVRGRASASSLPRSPRPLTFLCYKDVWIFCCTLPRVRSNEQRRSANENRKSNEDAGTVLSRKLDVSRPMERWNLKTPNWYRITQPSKRHITRREKKKRSHPGNQWWSKHFFFSHTNIDRSCLQPGSESTTCPLQWDCIRWATQCDPAHLHCLIT